MPDVESPLLLSTIEALSVHAPFDAMDSVALRQLASQLRLGYYPRGQAIVAPDSGIADRLYILKQGQVRGGAAAIAQAADVVLGTGECFPVGALVGRRATVYSYRAEQDCFCWELPAAGFHALVESNPRFREFCMDHIAALLEQSQRARRADAVASLSEGVDMLAPLRSAVARAPVSCSAETPVADVVRAMHAQRIGSMVVVDAKQAPVGIFTVPDVLARVTLPQLAMDTPIGKLMTPAPVCLEEEAPLVEAVLAMARRSRPPLGLLDGFVADDSAEFPGTLDLKAFRARPFVDAARVLSLAHALPPTGTAARLRAAGAAGVLPQEEAAASVEAFHYVQGLRLRRQHLEGDLPEGAENRIDPEKLNAVDRRILKAAFRQAALLQERLRMDFGL